MPHRNVPRSARLAAALLLAAIPVTRPLRAAPWPERAAGPDSLVTVYEDPSCPCCKEWVTYMRSAGFAVKVIDTPDMATVKSNAGVPGALQSCHTAFVGGYVIEGHVPAEQVRQLLATHPADIRGLAVPGMVTGSPGMDGPDPQHYDVVAFGRDGSTHLYAHR